MLKRQVTATLADYNPQEAIKTFLQFRKNLKSAKSIEELSFRIEKLYAQRDQLKINIKENGMKNIEIYKVEVEEYC